MSNANGTTKEKARNCLCVSLFSVLSRSLFDTVFFCHAKIIPNAMTLWRRHLFSMFHHLLRCFHSSVAAISSFILSQDCSVRLRQCFQLIAFPFNASCSSVLDSKGASINVQNSSNYSPTAEKKNERKRNWRCEKTTKGEILWKFFQFQVRHETKTQTKAKIRFSVHFYKAIRDSRHRSYALSLAFRSNNGKNWWRIRAHDFTACGRWMMQVRKCETLNYPKYVWVSIALVINSFVNVCLCTFITKLKWWTSLVLLHR